jgi:hypothetical protein
VSCHTLIGRVDICKVGQTLRTILSDKNWIRPYLHTHHGCQTVYFQTKNTNLGKFCRVLYKLETVNIIIWNIWRKFGILYDHLVHFSGFGIMHQEKSGNPDTHHLYHLASKFETFLKIIKPKAIKNMHHLEQHLFFKEFHFLSIPTVITRVLH